VAGPRATLEEEVKLEIGAGFELPELPGEPLEPRVFDSTYFDTADRRLGAAGITLRRRVEKGKSVWQLKVPRRSGRLEVEADGGPVPPSELVDPISAVLASRPLEPLVTMRTRRRPFCIRDGTRELAELVLDEVSVVDGQRSAKWFAELELERREATDDELRRLADVLRRAGARPARAQTKLEQVLGPVDARARADGVLSAAFAAQLRALHAHDPGARLGGDTEDVHQLRVATRRARAYLRLGRPLLNAAWAEPLRAELGWLGSSLGTVRDLDVLLDHLRADAALLGARDEQAAGTLLRKLETEREGLQADVLAALRSERYRALLEQLEEAARTDHRGDKARLGRLAAAEAKKLRKDAVRLTADAPDDELHALRIRAKRVRYAAELLGRKKVVARAKELQDVLGEHQDAVVAEERLRGLATGARGPSALAAGRLVERQHERRRAARTAFPKAWRRLERELESLR
jgi:CHAD domain-containing protein